MALGVVGDVNKEAGDVAGEILATNGAGEFEGLEGADALGGVSKAGAEFFEDGLRRADWVTFGSEDGQLKVVEGLAFGVGQEAIYTASDVTEMEGYGREMQRVGVDF